MKRLNGQETPQPSNNSEAEITSKDAQMENEKIFKSHGKRDDLAGEHFLGDLGQIIALVIFLTAWITDSFFVKYSNQFSDFAPIYVRLPLAMVILIVAGYLAKQGLTIVFAEVREKPVVIRKGVFGIVRHPIYLGAILLYLSALVLFLSVVSVLIWVLIILFYIYLCRYEEKLLLNKYGTDYEKYMSETPMLIPKQIRFRKNI
jgi:protein-S-isoprenylcysteine O-methyltransferase Ste14